MHKIDGKNATEDGQFQEYDPSTGQGATYITADWLNTVQGELMAFLEGRGVDPDKDDSAQVYKIVLDMFQSGLTGGAPVYASTAQGLSATAEGKYFSVPSVDPGESLILYRHASGGVAAEVARTPSSYGVLTAEAAAVAASEAAETQADRSEAARDAAQLASGVFSSTVEGLAATEDGAYFSVPNDDEDDFLTLYKNQGGAAVVVETYPSAAAIRKRVLAVPDIAALRALTGVQNGQVVYVSDDGAGGAGGYTLVASSTAEDLPAVVVLDGGLRAVKEATLSQAKAYTDSAIDAAAVPWYTRGDGQPIQSVFDATEQNGIILDGSGDVQEIVNLGSGGSFSLQSSGATNSPLVIRNGFRAVEFDGGSVYSPYIGGDSYAAGAFQSTFTHFSLGAIIQDAVGSDQVPIFLGVEASNTPRYEIRNAANGITKSATYHDGTTGITLASAGSQSEINQVNILGSYHNGVDECSLWFNGRAINLKEEETDLATADPLDAETVALGGYAGGARQVDGALVLAGFDNKASLTLDQAFAKYTAAYLKLGGYQEPAFALWSLGQSNAAGDFPNSNPLTFAAGEAYARNLTGAYAGNLDRDGFTQGGIISGDSSPAIWFADEWKKITGQVPIFQEQAFSANPITPGFASDPYYWAPQNSVGDDAGQQSNMDRWEGDLRRFRDLIKYSPQFSIKHNIGFIVEGERDAVYYNNGDFTDQGVLVEYMHSWLNALSAKYGIETFAIVNIGYNAGNLTEYSNNEPGMTFVREAWSQVISERADSYDVFPHLNHVPDPFSLDDLVTDADGVWVSGIAKQPDGLHYQDKMYEAFGRAAARNLATQLGITALKPNT